MYGHPIVPLGETGYGVSTAFGRMKGEPVFPLFTVFHASDGFRQALFSIAIDQPDRATICNVFYERVAELMKGRPHDLPP